MKIKKRTTKRENRFTLIKKALGEAGIFTIAIFFAFVIFMGVIVVSGQFKQPILSPPLGNAPTPINQSSSTQSKFSDGAYGRLAVRDLYVWDANTWVSNIRERALFVALAVPTLNPQECNLTTPVTFASTTIFSTALTRFCMDEDGCKLTLGAHNFDPIIRPGLTQFKGPVSFYISSSTGDWHVSSGGLVGGFSGFFVNTSVFGKDLNGIGEDILRIGNCTFTDNEFTRPGSPSGVCDSVNESDSIAGFGLRNTYVDKDGNGIPEAYCTLDIDD